MKINVAGHLYQLLVVWIIDGTNKDDDKLLNRYTRHTSSKAHKGSLNYLITKTNKNI